jgi:hypothetical protein
MADDPTAHAIDVVAHQVIADEVDLSWGNYPAIGADDWQKVGERVMKLTEDLRPATEVFEAAYEHLTHRATSQ